MEAEPDEPEPVRGVIEEADVAAATAAGSRLASDGAVKSAVAASAVAAADDVGPNGL